MPEITDGGARAFPIPSASGPVVGSDTGSYLGFTAIENTGSSPATMILYDNPTEAQGEILEVVSLDAGQSSGDNYERPGRAVLSGGIYAQISGAVKGSVFQ